MQGGVQLLKSITQENKPRDIVIDSNSDYMIVVTQCVGVNVGALHSSYYKKNQSIQTH